jgi:two-component system NarL family sensor kinase
MPAEPAELWAFYLSAAAVAIVLVVTAGAAVVVAQRKITAATRDYAARQIASLEEERGRVARELHDDVSQQIAVLSQRLEIIAESLSGAGGDQALVGATEAVGDGLRTLAGSVRVLAHRMHPSVLETLGLGPALRELARESLQGSELEVEVSVEEPLADPGPGNALALYRVAQEALRNVVKHSRAHVVTLRLTQSGATTTLEVADDGTGLPAEGRRRGGGLGMMSMQERLRLIGGELTIASTPGGGTVVRARVTRRPESPG